MENKKKKIINFKTFLPYFIRGIICFFVLTAITLLVYFFALNNARSFISLLDGLLVSSVIGYTISLFCYLVYSGSLNFFFYGFSAFGSIFQKNMERKYKDLNEYNEIKKEERAGKTYYFLSYIIISSVFLMVLIVLYILFLTGVVS